MQKIVYIGNDLNDYSVMKKCGIAICPSDAHKDIQYISNFVLMKKGGDGVARELLEEIFGLNLLEILYPID